MSGIDVEALLDSTADPGPDTSKSPETSDLKDNEVEKKKDRDRRRDRDGSRDRDRDRGRRRRDRSRDRRRERDADGDEEMKSPKSDRASANGSHRSRKRSRSRDSERKRSRRDRDRDRGDDAYRSSGGGGDFYRGGGRTRSRSRSPLDDRYYRPSGRACRDGDDRDDEKRHSRRDRDGRRRSPSKTPEPQLTEDERDRRTVFVQQLAARLRTKELIAFFEKVGPVKEAQIVKDRVSGRSKG